MEPIQKYLEANSDKSLDDIVKFLLSQGWTKYLISMSIKQYIMDEQKYD